MDNERVCPDCGATVRPGVVRCWLCASRLAEGGLEPLEKANPYASPAEVIEDGAQSFSLTTLLLFTTLVLVVCGVISFAPGIGIPLAVFTLVPLARTAFVVRARMAKGQVTRWSDRIGLALVSALVILAMCGITAVAAVATFAVACTAALGISGVNNNIGFSIVFWSMFVIAAIALLVVYGLWIRHRWRHDVAS